MRLSLLGTGTSFGVPQIGCRCPTCTSSDPRDRRSRTAALIETRGKRLLIDTPPELRLQLVAAGIDRIDAVLFTHAHADHVHGIDDLRALSVLQGAVLPVYGSRETMAELAVKFPYIFDPSFIVPTGTTKPELAREGIAVVARWAAELAPGRTLYAVGDTAYSNRTTMEGRPANVEVSSFEDWPDNGRTFDLITCAQAWHWVDPAVGAAKAARLLAPGGELAL